MLFEGPGAGQESFTCYYLGPHTGASRHAAIHDAHVLAGTTTAAI